MSNNAEPKVRQWPENVDVKDDDGHDKPMSNKMTLQQPPKHHCLHEQTYYRNKTQPQEEEKKKHLRALPSLHLQATQ